MTPSKTDTPLPLILIVDDDVIVRILLRQFLESEGFQVVEAVDGCKLARKFRDFCGYTQKLASA